MPLFCGCSFFDGMFPDFSKQIYVPTLYVR